MLLSVFTRHSAGCKFSKDRACRRCNCPKMGRRPGQRMLLSPKRQSPAMGRGRSRSPATGGSSGQRSAPVRVRGRGGRFGTKASPHSSRSSYADVLDGTSWAKRTQTAATGHGGTSGRRIPGRRREPQRRILDTQETRNHLQQTGVPGSICASGVETNWKQEERKMARGKKHSAEQVVNLLRQIEVAVANGKTTPQACKEAGIVEQT